jgi:hypothetical protein
MINAAPALLFWLAVALLQKFNWQLGVYTALVLLALLAAVPFVVAQARRHGDAVLDQAPRLLKAAALALLLVHVGYAVTKLRHPSLIDAATITIAEGQALRAGSNPYESRLDAEAEAATHDARFAGFKYLPVTIAAYLPLGGTLGPRGIVLTNLMLQLAVAALIFRLGAAMASASAGWLAVLLYLSLPVVPFQLFAKGALDLVAVVPLVAALLLVERNAALAGLCVGLSLAAKLLPGALVAPCVLPSRPRDRLLYAAGIAVGLLPVVPFAIWSPGALFDNIVLFNVIRPADSTSWLVAAPSARPAMAAAMALLYLAAAADIWLRPPALARRCGVAVALILASLIAAPAVHHNYQLWWLPLACALLGVALAPWRLPSVAPAATKSRLGSI